MGAPSTGAAARIPFDGVRRRGTIGAIGATGGALRWVAVMGSRWPALVGLSALVMIGTFGGGTARSVSLYGEGGVLFALTAGVGAIFGGGGGGGAEFTPEARGGTLGALRGGATDGAVVLADGNGGGGALLAPSGGGGRVGARGGTLAGDEGLGASAEPMTEAPSLLPGVVGASFPNASVCGLVGGSLANGLFTSTGFTSIGFTSIGFTSIGFTSIGFTGFGPFRGSGGALLPTAGGAIPIVVCRSRLFASAALKTSAPAPPASGLVTDGCVA